jgi:hypothetical protein
MKPSLILVLAALLTACETPQSRIKRNRELFDSYPPPIQTLIRAGNVEVGFTSDQARMALGKPDRIIMEATPSVTHEVWLYGVGASRVSLGLGFGMFGGGGHTAMGTGVGVSSAGGGSGEKIRLTFANGSLVGIWRQS